MSTLNHSIKIDCLSEMGQRTRALLSQQIELIIASVYR